VQVISDDSAGMHSLVWYATDAERAKWPPAPKAKLKAVRLAAELPAPEAWALAQRFTKALDARRGPGRQPQVSRATLFRDKPAAAMARWPQRLTRADFMETQQLPVLRLVERIRARG
jgi:hypothetical protein